MVRTHGETHFAGCEAFVGCIISIPNHGMRQLGDTLTEAENMLCSGLPFSSSEACFGRGDSVAVFV
jgi:peptide subunit release factor RF-3